MSDEPIVERRLELVASNETTTAHPEPTPIRGADVVLMLEELLVDARAGKFVAGGAFVVTTHGSVTCVQAGSTLANVQMVAGAALLERNVLDGVLRRA